MKSYWIVTKGNDAVIEPREVPVPKPGAGDLLVRVHAAGLNRGELIVGGAVHGGPEKLGGTECSGVVEAVGEGVTDWKTGDRVIGRARGTFAEYTLMHAGQAMPAPERLTSEQAAAIPSSFLTSYEALVQYGKLKAGEWLLVGGATSGVGVGSILTAQVLGAHTIGTSGSAAKLEKLKSIGLDVGIHSRAGPYAEQVREATGGRGANLAVNLVGGTAFPELLRTLAYEGRMAIVGYVDRTYLSQIDLADVHLNRIQIFGISNAKLRLQQRFETTRGFVRDILPAIAQGRVTPVVDRVFPFEEVAAAKDYLESDAVVGKVIVRIAS